MIFSRSTLLHARFPFSILLLPVFLLALLSAENPDPWKSLGVFLALHLFLYPAANGFNSYYDRDTESIGLLRHPPAVTPDLLPFSLLLDAAALVLAWKVGPLFFAGCLIYGLASKAYSWPGTRIKKYPVIGWLFTGLGQGTLTFILIAGCVQPGPFPPSGLGQALLPAILAGFLLLGFYPMTQAYQHAEDARRGDMTLSRLLGVRGTFRLALVFLGVSFSGITAHVFRSSGTGWAFFFMVSAMPGIFYFIRLMLNTRIDYGRVKVLSLLTSGGINLFGAAALWMR